MRTNTHTLTRQKNNNNKRENKFDLIDQCQLKANETDTVKDRKPSHPVGKGLTIQCQH